MISFDPLRYGASGTKKCPASAPDTSPGGAYVRSLASLKTDENGTFVLPTLRVEVTHRVMVKAWQAEAKAAFPIERVYPTVLVLSYLR
jgi:hypothetical protein